MEVFFVTLGERFLECTRIENCIWRRKDEKTITAFTLMFLCVTGFSFSYEVFLGHPGSGIPDYYFNGLRSFFDSQSDINYNYVLNGVMPSNLSIYDLYITYSAGLSSHPTYNLYEYTQSEIVTIKNYLHSGGRVLFFSDHTEGGFG